MCPLLEHVAITTIPGLELDHHLYYRNSTDNIPPQRDVYYILNFDDIVRSYGKSCSLYANSIAYNSPLFCTHSDPLCTDGCQQLVHYHGMVQTQFYMSDTLSSGTNFCYCTH